MKKFRKVGDAILFLQYLRRYSNKFLGRRKRFITKMMSSDTVKAKFIEMKLFFNSHFKPFY